MTPPVIRDLDFSEFHPLDHWPGGSRCRSLPGGWRNHLELAWTYRWSRDIRATTWCRVGRHEWGEGWVHGEPAVLCGSCWRRKE